MKGFMGSNLATASVGRSGLLKIGVKERECHCEWRGSMSRLSCYRIERLYIPKEFEIPALQDMVKTMALRQTETPSRIPTGSGKGCCLGYCTG